MAEPDQTPGWEPERWPLRLVCWYARKIPEHPAKGRLLQWLVGAMCPDGGWLRSVDGARFYVDPGEYIGRAIITAAGFEPQSIHLATEIMRGARGGVFLDVGANQGIFSCAVGCAAGCQVVAVEAAPETFVRLQRNVLANSTLRATLVHSCAAAASGLIKFFVPRDGHRAAWSGPNPKQSVAREDLLSFWSAAAPLQSILADLAVPAVHLLKIDVEGFELEVFCGLDWEGRFRPRHIIMECDPDEREKIAFLERQGYSARLIGGATAAGATDFPEGNLWFVDGRPEVRG
jgi:FkbM family methyltransferase